ncbi:hypothetical protein LTR78_007917 [Recurvomyces mirabilis]|uniref:Uncharacterized protein n=1 Tax=Recurvomyces mirabilis TaxID=574656 RepID=A0AAE0WFX1_9PEZI|nr:hypothetical protein LTR78_007917 [Recurvomyces mirabilis]KAK5152452.1 hypothetical protein LTS14_008399 [Recurvomyces mirabilis]
MSTSAFSPHDPYLLKASGLIGAFVTLFGTAILVRPSFGLSAWKFISPTASKDKQLALDQFRLFGVREAFLGTALVTCWFLGEPKVLGWLMLATIPVAVVDGVVQRSQTGGGEWSHWGLVPVVFGLGGGLLGWFERMI